MPTLSCLKNYIKIEACNAPAYTEGTQSDLIINKDLPISVESIDRVADAEQGSFLNVWDEVQNRALSKFVIKVKAGYRDLFDTCDIDDTWFCDNKEELGYPLLYFLGSELMYERMNSSRKNSWTTVDADKAASLKADFDSEFLEQLKAALEVINDDQANETGDIFSYTESIP